MRDPRRIPELPGDFRGLIPESAGDLRGLIPKSVGNFLGISLRIFRSEERDLKPASGLRQSRRSRGVPLREFHNGSLRTASLFA